MTSRIKNFQQYKDEYARSVQDPESFWAKYAKDEFEWIEPWTKVHSANFEEARFSWFEGAKLNITTNCLDRHAKTQPDRKAIIWEPNDPKEETRTFTYKQLLEEVCRCANMLHSLGVKKGDRVCLYMPMIPELAIAVLACARIGAVHSVVFAGFSSQSLAERINDASCSIVLTSDWSYRGEKTVPLKSIVDQALEQCECVNNVIVYKRTGQEISWKQDRDLWWHEEIDGKSNWCDAAVMDAEDPLFILYTSGSTGKPKGMVHSCGGYMVYTNYTFKQVFQYQVGQVYWCTADIGWITGHSYIVYGPLSAGATSLMYEGVPFFPDKGRLWDVVDKHQVEIFYTAPTAIRALAQYDPKYVERSSLASLKVLGTVGEPINEEAWNWYNKNIGKENCPIVDTWWQTETGGIMISPLAGITPTIPTYATKPIPGIVPVLLDEKGEELSEMKAEGNLCIKSAWPSIARTIYGDHERYKRVYFQDFPGYYFTGDGSKRDEEGNYRITGRMDDIVIVSGHNLGTAEIENALDEHPKVAEAAVIGYPHEIKGQAICAFLTLYEVVGDVGELKSELIKLVSDTIGPIAKPDRMYVVPALPKTRSGKIMRRILRKLAAGELDQLGDISTLLNPEAVEMIKERMSLTS